MSGTVDFLCASTLDGMELWGVIFGGGGFVAGVFAVIYAAIANHRSKQSAKDATDANDLARESNDIAKDAKQLAQEANEISHRGEQREVERHDVHWEGEWQEPGIYVMVKRGNDEAHDVVATVTADGEEQTQRADLAVEDGHTLVYKFPSAAAAFRREVEQYRRQKEAEAASPYPGLTSSHMWPFHRVSERVLWSTKRGTPKTHEESFPLTSFSRFCRC